MDFKALDLNEILPFENLISCDLTYKPAKKIELNTTIVIIYAGFGGARPIQKGSVHPSPVRHVHQEIITLCSLYIHALLLSYS